MRRQAPTAPEELAVRVASTKQPIRSINRFFDSLSVYAIVVIWRSLIGACNLGPIESSRNLLDTSDLYLITGTY